MFKFISTCFFLIFIYSKVDFTELFESAKHLKFGTIFSCLLLYSSSQFLSAIKWKLISNNLLTPLSTYLKAYFTGMFISSSGLGVVGGDMTRAFLVQKNFKNIPSAISSVIVDRLHGLFCLAALGFIFSALTGFFSYEVNFGLVKESLTYNAFFLGTCLFSLLFIYKKPNLKLKVFNKILEKLSFLELNKYINFLKSPSVLLKANLLSIISHFNQILMYSLILKDFELAVPLIFLLAAIPAVNIMSSLPISYQGLGIREFMLFYFLKDFGLSVTECSLTGATWLVFALSINLTSGLLMLSPEVKLKEKRKYLPALKKL